jgi:type III restriction enzyme
MTVLSDPYSVPTSRRPSRLPMVDAIRTEVDAWRNGGYAGSSGTSRRLLEHWFLDGHQTEDGLPFAYFFAQREAMEILVYLFEVAGIRSSNELLARYSPTPMAPSGQPFPRYVIKMATGSGKTKVMGLAIAWSYFHALREPDSPLSSTALIVAPNLIVYERLRADFEAGRIFRTDPVVPPEWRADFDLQVVLRDDPVPMTATGVLCLTNIHVLYERREAPPTNPVNGLLGRRPVPGRSSREDPVIRLAERGRVLVINDEAHHLHDEIRADTGEPLVALRVLNRLHSLAHDGIVAQVDFSATPRNQRGQPFPEIVTDYPLAQAIDDGIVKRPIIGELSGELEVTSNDASVRYRQRIGAGVAKWREFRERLAPSGRKPLLFIMAESTQAADQIARYLETLPDLAGRVLTIHVNMAGPRRGEIATADLEQARRWAREVDQDDNPYAAIVSVLMLREGWDVRNVTVIVPLRAYSARAQILPEQTLGRGLRRMDPPGSGWEERLVVIEHEAFRRMWDEELAEEDLELQRAAPQEIGVPALVVAVLPERVPRFDISIPQLTRHLVRREAGLEQLTVDDLPPRQLRLPERLDDETVDYTGRDLRTGKVVERATYPLPRAEDPVAVLAWFVHELERQTRLTGQFAVLAPLVKGYVEARAFGRRVGFGDPLVLRALADPSVQETVLGVLREAIDAATLATVDVVAERAERRLSSTRPFLWNADNTTPAERSVFNLQPCDSGFEKEISAFFDRCTDVAAFAKLAPAARLSMEYRRIDGHLAYYYPDFVVREADGTHFLVEAKGIADLDVPVKDRRAARWAVDATVAIGVRWNYMRIDQVLFDRYMPRLRTFADLVDLFRTSQWEAARQRRPRRGRRSPDELVALMDSVSARVHEPSGVVEEIRRMREESSG